MSVQGEDNNGPDASAAEARPADGLIDFSHYSVAQLRELQFSIDKGVFPQNFSNLLLELARREQRNDAASSAQPRTAGRFTLRDGFLGWLDAKRRRSLLYGKGALEVRSNEAVAFGWQRTWLGAPLQTQITIPFASIRNVVQDGTRIRFQTRARFRLPRHFEFSTESDDEAANVVTALPRLQTSGFEKQWSEVCEFNRLLSATNRPVITPAIVILNFAVFTAMSLSAGRLGEIEVQQALNWGANFGPLTVGGQWWRLVSALFVHMNLMHVLINMWAFWNVGRLTERLYGRWAFLALYITAGTLASLASIAWDPNRVSLGASGAIFAIFGAFLAFLAHRQTQVPTKIFRAYWISTAVFVVFSLVNGVMQMGVDNAAHFGGLVSGFVLGWVLARPLSAAEREPFVRPQITAAAALTVAAVLAGLWQVNGLGSQLTIPEHYFQSHNWYVVGAADNQRRWQALAMRAGAGSISETELAAIFKQDILPFWQETNKRLQQENKSLTPIERPFALLVANLVSSREQVASAVVAAGDNSDAQNTRSLAALVEKVDMAQARVERATVRASMDHRPRALAHGPWITRIRGLFATNTRACVESPVLAWRFAGAADSKLDGPAIRQAIACHAQQLFMSGDYTRLDDMLRQYDASLGDLPDGGSAVDGVWGGLEDLFEYGRLDVQDVLGRISDWRRLDRTSVESDLVETLFFRDWAWSARGTGAAREVSAQGMAVFKYRSEMAAAGLEESTTRAVADPLWYELFLTIGLDRSIGLPKMRTAFDRGAARFPGYFTLHRAMLRALQPRWGGSFEQVDEFITTAANNAGGGRGSELYARLYWIYAGLEQDDINIFDDASASWRRVKVGFKQLLAHYPHSDLMLNAYAKFACLAGDAAEYQSVRPRMQSHMATRAWTTKVSVKSCDAKFAAASNVPGISSTPNDVKSWADWRHTLHEAEVRKDWKTLQSSAREYIQSGPDDEAYGYAMVGEAELRTRQLEAAVADFKASVRLSPSYVFGWAGLGEADLRNDDYWGAVDAFTRTIALKPQDWDAWGDRAVAYQALGQDAAAFSDAQKACAHGSVYACRLVKWTQRH